MRRQKSRELIESVYSLVQAKKHIRARKTLKAYLLYLQEEDHRTEFFWVVANLDLRKLDPESASNIGMIRTQFLGGLQRAEIYEA